MALCCVFRKSRSNTTYDVSGLTTTTSVANVSVFSCISILAPPCMVNAVPPAVTKFIPDQGSSVCCFVAAICDHISSCSNLTVAPVSNKRVMLTPSIEPGTGYLFVGVRDVSLSIGKGKLDLFSFNLWWSDYGVGGYYFPC